MLAAIVQSLTLLLTGSFEAEVAAMTPREKAEAVVVAGMPAGEGFGGVLVRQWNTELARPRGALVFADQEGGVVKTFRALAPWRAASQYRSTAEAFRAGRETAADLRRSGVHAAFAPVLDLADGPLGSRHFARPAYGVAFARVSAAPPASSTSPGSARRRSRPTPRGSTASSAARIWRRGRRPRRRPLRDGRARDLSPARAAQSLVRAEDYELLRGLGFRGVAITDSIGVLGSPYAPFWARLAVRAGADLVLTTSARDARRIVDALVRSRAPASSTRRSPGF